MDDQQSKQKIGPEAIGRALGGVFGLIFLGIGLTVIISLWSQSADEFGAPPLFFRVFGSFIALGFVAFGLAMSAGALLAGRKSFPNGGFRSGSESRKQAEVPPSKSGYICPHCGAPLAEGADVSPHGDVKCGYCKVWFNVHAKA